MRDNFQQIREEIEARQRSILWPDYLYATRNTVDFLWNGAPNPRMVQCVGLAVFGMYFLTAGVALISLSAESESAWLGPLTVFGGVQVLFSLRVLRNAFFVIADPPSSGESANRDQGSGV